MRTYSTVRAGKSWWEVDSAYFALVENQSNMVEPIQKCRTCVPSVTKKYSGVHLPQPKLSMTHAIDLILACYFAPIQSGESPNVAEDWVRIGECNSTELIHSIPHTNDKAGCLYTHLVIFPAVPKWYPASLSSLEPCTPTNGSAIVKEIENTWRLASSNSTSVSLIYVESNIDRWMFVATGLQRCLS